jgi:hypothetical protein
VYQYLFSPCPLSTVKSRKNLKKQSDVIRVNVSFSKKNSLLIEIREFREIYEISKKNFKNFDQIQSLTFKLL